MIRWGKPRATEPGNWAEMKPEVRGEKPDATGGNGAGEMSDDGQKRATRRAKGAERRGKLGPGRRKVDRRVQSSKTWHLRRPSHSIVMEGKQTGSRGKWREEEEERDEETRGWLRWAMRMSLVGWATCAGRIRAGTKTKHYVGGKEGTTATAMGSCSTSYTSPQVLRR
ncbi:uncharacterized protein LY79DRAFT_567864 [Colletotrichum navitas]|uniref:Uncharacterized protein n=1 Tax=Colletotrichum navitas TaxID=681940 RepID=A0AAD8UZK9_9PEZI|nr:uncharacterized protein LY79DRAFT_567864 [Colletotrichum navitas]KAK1573762.1 hypothetical protein LY79DRAFT_567864 [Colletotrichum navitas]